MVLSVSSQEQDFLGHLLLHQHVQVDPVHLLVHERKKTVFFLPCSSDKGSFEVKYT